ncbi:MAG: UDP-3-O-(3-hydroxymyristoyl)glucosamine N-acyltransferase [Bacteroidetes bacterium]|nr:MAG: UDP-3-O-(3-hydroxymyristoyl)glucosamine N-acyltransferase [Bacteroidota bacterium]
MEFTVKQIAGLIQGKITGNETLLISNIAGIEDAKAGEISFLSNARYESFLYTTQASAVIVNRDFVPKQEVKTTLIFVENAYTSFAILLEEYKKIVKALNKSGIEKPSYQADTAVLSENIYLGAFSYIGENARIGKNVKIYPNTYIGDRVKIGDNTVVHAGVKIYAGCQIGQDCTIQAGAVIGSDGFGFAPQPDGSYKTIPQLGIVIIKDKVDVGANTVIDCATMGATIIESGVKLDNLIQVAHNVQIGKNTVMAAQSGISGSSKLGENCIVAGQVGIVGHLDIANRTTMAAQSGVTKSIKKDGTAIMGAPAMEHKQNLRAYAIYRNLPELQKRIESLEKKLANL